MAGMSPENVSNADGYTYVTEAASMTVILQRKLNAVTIARNWKRFMSKLMPTRKFSSRKNLAHSSATARPFVWMAYCTVTRFWLYFRTVGVKNRKKSSPAKVGSPP